MVSVECRGEFPFHRKIRKRSSGRVDSMEREFTRKRTIRHVVYDLLFSYFSSENKFYHDVPRSCMTRQNRNF